ncbi:hypothetical protein PMAC_001796 [Pneumocystis sp. 'macacae']|nr:hypothetical protein PMAC_001796 [Pneumocystis sp. 'macacae']
MLMTFWTHTHFYLTLIRCRKDKRLISFSLSSTSVMISGVFLFLGQKCYSRGLKIHHVYLKKNILLPLGINNTPLSSLHQRSLRRIFDFFKGLRYKEFCKNQELREKKNVMLRRCAIGERIFRIYLPGFRVYGCKKFSTLSFLLKSSGSGGNHGKGKFNGKNQEHSLQKPVVPEVYPRMMALPIVRRPLFPGFYKAVVIKNPSVTEAIKEMIKRGQPYIGAFLLKEDVDTDTITNINQIYNVGVFSQITSVFPANNTGDENALTVVLYPHRRIKIVNLIGSRVNANEVENSEELINNHDNMKSENIDSTAYIEEQNVENNSFNKEAIDDSSINDDSHYATSFLNTYDVSLVNVENLVDEDFDPKNNIIKAVTSEIVSVFKDIATFNPLFRDQIANFSMSQSIGNVFEEPAKLADFAAAVSAGEVAELQDILETLSIEARLQKSLLVLKKELMNAQLQSKISKDVESKIQKRQREYYLIEQMKGIKRELGLESDGKDKLVEKFKDKASKLSMPENVKKTFDEELNKLIHLEPSASEFNVTRNYLDWLTQIPWGQQSTENYDINHAMKVLDEDHYGLKDIKDRILEFIAVGKLRGSVEGKILCFVGPPGVGKTSIGKSIARALDRQFYRFSVGGLSDVAEIKGHRRTYVGAMPGKIIQSLKKVQTENPLILIDEVDKIGRGHQGDPSSALLELLDPEQNSSFLDHYLDLPVDLSKVLFVCTANIIDTIPGPLLDRMEIIHISGYVADEKMAIAKNYLAPEAKELAGLKNIDVNLTDDAIESLIKYYCRESGVRNLKKHINKVYRKSTLDIVKSLEETVEESLTDEKRDHQKEKDHDDFKVCFSEASKKTWKPLKVPDSISITIDSSNLKNYVGPPIFTTDRLYDIAPPGVVMGLAWTSQGGAVLYVESILENVISATSKPNFICTGQLGDIMKESSTIAYSYSKSYISQNYPNNKFFEKARIHLHCPEGAVPKDGPSAGITMTTSILSLALNHPVSPSIAMTGEITLTGKVLRIGGLREKVVAAKRSGVDTIIYPEANQADWDILPDNIKKGLIGVPVNWYFDVFGVVFKDIDNSKVSMLWQNEIDGNISKTILQDDTSIDNFLLMSIQSDQSINSVDEHDIDLKDWIIRVKKLQEERDREDEERNKKLEEEILAERRARHERRAQREFSLSPDRLSYVSSPASRHSEYSFSSSCREKTLADLNFLNSPSFKCSSARNINEYLKHTHDVLEQKCILDKASKKTSGLSLEQGMFLDDDNTQMYSHNTVSFRNKKEYPSVSSFQSKDDLSISSLGVEKLTKTDSDSLKNKQISSHNLSNNYSSSEGAGVSRPVTFNIPLNSSSKSSLYSDSLTSNKLFESDALSSISSNNNLSLIMSDISRNQFKGSFVQSAVMKNNDSKSPSKLSRNNSISSHLGLKMGTEALVKTPTSQKTLDLNKKGSLEVTRAFSEEKESVLLKVSSKLDSEKPCRNILENTEISIKNKSSLKNYDDLKLFKNRNYENSLSKPVSLESEKSNISPVSYHEFQNVFHKKRNSFLDNFSTPDSISSRDMLSSNSYKEKFGSFSDPKMDSFKAGILDVKNNLRPSSRTSSPKYDPFKDGILNAKESLRPLSASREKLDVSKERFLAAKSSLAKSGNSNRKILANDSSPLTIKKLNHVNNTSLNVSNVTMTSLLKKDSKLFPDSQRNFQSNMNLKKGFTLSRDYSSLSHLSMGSHTAVKNDNNELTYIDKNYVKDRKKNSINSVEALDTNTSHLDLASNQTYQDNDKVRSTKSSNLTSNNISSLKKVQKCFNDEIKNNQPFNNKDIQFDLDSELLAISFKDDINNNFSNEKSDTASTDVFIAAWTETLSKKSEHTKPLI